MKILLTGITSFTGMWFAKKLTEAGHEIIATLQNKKHEYKDLKLKRLNVLEGQNIKFIENCSFGDKTFIKLIDNSIDSVNHHGANVKNYKSPDFDYIQATKDNTDNIKQVLELCKKNGIKQIVLTGSVFEQDEGIGSISRGAFSPYGLSKGLTYQIFKYWTEYYSLNLKKFIIPNPFGPYEEHRLCQYLISKWKNGEIPHVSTPNYIRDNIHVEKLAQEYLRYTTDSKFIQKERYGPSGYIESQGDFVQRFAYEINKRLFLKTQFTIDTEHALNEPMIRINRYDNTIDDDEKYWNSLASYYNMNK